MSIRAYLNEIADPGTPIKTSRLSRLSHLDAEDQASVASMWPALPVEKRVTVLEQLTQLAEDSPELDFDAVFLTALRDQDGRVRRLAIEGLWEQQGRHVIPEFVRMVQEDPDAGVRAAAALALGRFVLLGEYGDLRPSDQVFVTDTLRAVYGDPSESTDVRGRALEALGASSQPWARDLIEEAYSSGDDHLMASALHAMGRSADDYWLPTLLDELGSADPILRFEAAGALGSIADPEAVPHLAELIEDEDPEVRTAAIQALGEIGGEDAIDTLREARRTSDDSLAEALDAALEQAEFGDDPLGLRP